LSLVVSGETDQDNEGHLNTNDVERLLSYSNFINQFPDFESLNKEDIRNYELTINDMRIILGVGKLAKHSNYSVQIRLVPRLIQLIALAPYIIYETNFDWKETPHHHDFIRELTSILLEIAKNNSELSQVISNQIWKSYETWGDNIAQIEGKTTIHIFTFNG
jgi:hypothetical protein